MNDVELSIILPTYNGEQYIFETISSILNSKYENFELLIIDDSLYLVTVSFKLPYNSPNS